MAACILVYLKFLNGSFFWSWAAQWMESKYGTGFHGIMRNTRITKQQAQSTTAINPLETTQHDLLIETEM